MESNYRSKTIGMRIYENVGTIVQKQDFRSRIIGAGLREKNYRNVTVGTGL